MDIVCISDTHNYLNYMNIPDGDILIHAGDATGRGTLIEVSTFVHQFEKLPHKIKIFVPGNHDMGFETHEDLYRKMFKNTHVLIDQSIIINGIKIYGSPWQPEFYDWAFNLPRGPKLKQKWDLIPEDTDILITHGPPKRILDQAPDGFYCGCEELLEAVKRIEPTYHIFGHIHAGYGIETIGNTTFVNASSCTEQYKPINLPITLSI